jgi:hypothetical protein
MRMRVHPLRSLLLLLALLAGQWLAVAHAHEHPALTVDQACALCVHVPGLDDAALAATAAAIAADAHVGGVTAALRPAPRGRAPSVLRNRGPPVS